jgi:hypothetical protein
MHRLLEIKHKLLLGHEWILERSTNSVDRGNSHFATWSCEPLLGSRSHQDSLEFCVLIRFRLFNRAAKVEKGDR